MVKEKASQDSFDQEDEEEEVEEEEVRWERISSWRCITYHSPASVERGPRKE